jgi:hypothetical protein
MKKLLVVAAISMAVLGFAGCADKNDGMNSKCGAQEKCGTEKKCTG